MDEREERWRKRLVHRKIMKKITGDKEELLFIETKRSEVKNG